eukprot:Platyproteum_vivax@DN1324_c0_g1_i1.p1
MTNTLIIFDWDDTLFPTTAFNNDTLESAVLHQLDEVVLHLLQTAGRLGVVMIVTAAKLCWVQQSLSSMPLVYEYVLANNVGIVSAADEFSHMPVECQKTAAFRRLCERKYTRLVSIGDGDSEVHSALIMRAVHRDNMSVAVCKLQQELDAPQLLNVHLDLLQSLPTIIEPNTKFPIGLRSHEQTATCV